MSPRVAGSGVICQKKWGMISETHFESKRCYSGATHGSPPPHSWTATGLVCRAPPHLEESGEEQVWALKMTHRPVAGGIEYGFVVREMELVVLPILRVESNMKNFR